MRSGPRIEDIFAVRVMALTPIAVDVDACRRLLDRTPPALRRSMPVTLLAARIVERAAIYVVDRDTLVQAANSAPPGPLDLPPLPFPRVIFEAEGDTLWSVAAADWVARHPGEVPREEASDAKRIQNVYLEERTPGELWYGYMFFQDAAAQPLFDGPGGEELFARRIRITSTGVQTQCAGGDWAEENVALHRFVVEAMHFITARGVSLAPIKPSRQVRRNNERKGILMPEHLYWVHIADELQTGPQGQSERIYRYRWLVRGHWRRLPEKRIWVKAYIKGPPGAPWKGRPVYRVPGATDPHAKGSDEA